MTVRVAFLRAINLGRRRVAMAQLVDIFEDAGFAGAWTYINSGNVVFEATGRRAEVEKRLEDALERNLGFEVTTFVRTSGELRQAVTAKPFAVSAGDTYFLTFLKTSRRLRNIGTKSHAKGRLGAAALIGPTVFGGAR